MIQSESVYCSLDCPDNLLVIGDATQLGECFDELVRNAMHWFDKESKTVSITASLLNPDLLPDGLDSSSSYVLVHVRDNGVGVPTENKAKIFNAFFTTHAHGTGLGLALTRRLIEGHGGMIVESGKPGVGADFEIYLPVPDEPGLINQIASIAG